MAKEHRKMLGDVNAPEVQALIQLINTQSKGTICKWCIDYAETHILPIFEKRYPNDDRPRKALNAARDYLDGKVKFPIVKDIILNQCHAAARELDSDPASQAAARACGQGASVVHTLSHSLGLYFYGSAAVAYDRIGTGGTAEEYDEIAREVCADLTATLQAVAIVDEPNPAKIKWHC
ncbi:MAG: hypothetical protein GXX92_07415 [Clostridiales bacterium]|nr:hypothetical protein [Clostridiales bacterium]